jgi:hypothetical protein
MVLRLRRLETAAKLSARPAQARLQTSICLGERELGRPGLHGIPSELQPFREEAELLGLRQQLERESALNKRRTAQFV